MPATTLKSHALPGVPPAASGRSLHLLSFNIQAGIDTQRYSHYITRGLLQHVLPHGRKRDNLDRIAQVIHQYDVVALQEVDGGSLRSGFLNQVEYLAARCQFPFWVQQCNRNLGHFGQHGNGLLSRYRPERVEEHPLPGPVPGRGALVSWFGSGEQSLMVVNLHLALSRRARGVQLGYVRELIEQQRHVVIMGDMNTHLDQLLVNSPLAGAGLYAPDASTPTYPSWRPSRAIDHILLSPELRVKQVEALPATSSDHLPLAVEIQLPPGIRLGRRVRA